VSGGGGGGGGGIQRCICILLRHSIVFGDKPNPTVTELEALESHFDLTDMQTKQLTVLQSVSLSSSFMYGALQIEQMGGVNTPHLLAVQLEPSQFRLAEPLPFRRLSKPPSERRLVGRSARVSWRERRRLAGLT
jgi:hypothetical protein